MIVLLSLILIYWSFTTRVTNSSLRGRYYRWEHPGEWNLKIVLALSFVCSVGQQYYRGWRGLWEISTLQRASLVWQMFNVSGKAGDVDLWTRHPIHWVCLAYQVWLAVSVNLMWGVLCLEWGEYRSHPTPALKEVTVLGCERQVYKGRLFLPELIRKGFVEEVTFAGVLAGWIAFGHRTLGCMWRQGSMQKRHGLWEV